MFRLFKSSNKAWHEIIDWGDYQEAGEKIRFSLLLQGVHHHRGGKKAKVGDQLFPVHEPNNPYDREAIAFLDRKSRKVGYMKGNIDFAVNGYHLKENIIAGTKPVCIIVECKSVSGKPFIDIRVEVSISGFSKSELVERLQMKMT